ncbi:uncharacterized protein LOC144918035 [Branchiostoma floridae x Branchiostoma belcheri]
MGSKVSKGKQTTQVAPETVAVSHNSCNNTRFARLAGNAGKMKKRVVKCFTRRDRTAAVVPDVEVTEVNQVIPKQPMNSRVDRRQQTATYVMIIFVVLLTITVLDWSRGARRVHRFERHNRRHSRTRHLPPVLRLLRLSPELHMLVRLN